MLRQSAVPLIAVALLLAACDKKKEEPAVKPAPQQPAPQASGTSSALDDAKKTGAEIASQAEAKGKEIADKAVVVANDVADKAKVAGAEIKTKAEAAGQQIKESATDLKERSKAAIDAFKKQPVAASTADSSTEAGRDALVKQLTESAKNLATNPAVTAPVKEQLSKLADSVLGNQDGAAAEALDKIVSLKPSDDQMGVVKEIQTNFGVLALGRNFDQNDPAYVGAVKQTIDAIRSQNVTNAVAGLQKIGTSAKLTDSQKQIASHLVSSYGGALAGVSDKVNKATESVNKVTEGLKGLGF